jgi:hypothetical protein
MTRFWNNLHQVRNVTSLGADESKGTNRIAQIGHAHSSKQKVFKKKWGRGRGVTPGFRRVRVIYAVVFFSLLFSSVLNVESL